MTWECFKAKISNNWLLQSNYVTNGVTPLTAHGDNRQLVCHAIIITVMSHSLMQGLWFISIAFLNSKIRIYVAIFSFLNISLQFSHMSWMRLQKYYFTASDIHNIQNRTKNFSVWESNLRHVHVSRLPGYIIWPINIKICF